MRVSTNILNRLNYLISVQKYLIYFLPITLVTGSFLSDLSVSLVAIIFLITTVIERKWRYLFNYFSLIFFTWCGYLIIRSILSENPILSLESSLFYWRFGLFSLALWYLLDHSASFKSNIFFIFFIVFLFLFIDGFIQFVTGYNLIGYSYYTVDGQRVSGMFGDESILGNYIARILPILVALLLSFKKNIRIYNFIAVLCTLIGGVLILISGERTAFLYYVIFLSVLIFLLINWRYEKLILISLLFTIALGLFMTESSIKQRIFLNTLVEINWEQETSKYNFIPEKYKPIYHTSLKMIKDKPIFGIGTKMYREQCKNNKYFVKNGCTTHPHNTYLQLLAETGVIGLIPIFFLFLLISFIFLLHLKYYLIQKKVLLSNEKIVFLGALFIYFFPFIPSLNFFHNWYSIITFIPIGFCLHLFHEEMFGISESKN